MNRNTESTHSKESAETGNVRFFNGDRLEVSKRELEGRRATVYHRTHDGKIETLFGRIVQCNPETINFATDYDEPRELRGEHIANWIIGAMATR